MQERRTNSALHLGHPFRGLENACYRWFWQARIALGKTSEVYFYACLPMNYICFAPIHRLLPEVVIVAGNQLTSDYLSAQGIPHRLELGFPKAIILADYPFWHKKGHGKIPPNVKLIQINHGLGLAKPYYYEAAAKFRMDFHLCSGKWAQERLEQLGVSRVTAPGFAKLDALFDGSLNKAEICRNLGISEGKPIILYAPTWGQLSSIHQLLPHLRTLTSDYNLMLKIHDNTLKDAEVMKELRNLTNTSLIKDADSTPYLFIADLLISDISSIVFEFALLNKPILLVTPNSVQWQEQVTASQWWRVGHRLTDFSMLAESVGRLLCGISSAETEFRRELPAKAGIPCDGQAALRSAKLIEEFINSN